MGSCHSCGNDASAPTMRTRGNADLCGPCAQRYDMLVQLEEIRGLLKQMLEK